MKYNYIFLTRGKKNNMKQDQRQQTRVPNAFGYDDNIVHDKRKKMNIS
jgi:ribosomal protein L44E